MVRVPEEPEDPFLEEEEDPFKETYEEQRDGFKTELDKYRADLKAASKKSPTCGIVMWGGSEDSYKIFNSGKNRFTYKGAYDAENNCLSYSIHPTSTNSICYLYNKEATDLPKRQL
jgi:hypothetical protein